MGEPKPLLCCIGTCRACDDVRLREQEARCPTRHPRISADDAKQAAKPSPLSHQLTASQRHTVAHFLRRERLWPLLKAIWKFRRMRGDTFALIMALDAPFEPADPFSRKVSHG